MPCTSFLPQIKKIPPDLISFSTFCSVFVLPFTVKFLTEFIIIILLFTLLHCQKFHRIEIHWRNTDWEAETPETM